MKWMWIRDQLVDGKQLSFTVGLSPVMHIVPLAQFQGLGGSKIPTCTEFHRKLMNPQIHSGFLKSDVTLEEVKKCQENIRLYKNWSVPGLRETTLKIFFFFSKCF